MVRARWTGGWSLLILSLLLTPAGARATDPVGVARLSVAAPGPALKPGEPQPELGWIRLESTVTAEVMIDGLPLRTAAAIPVLAPLNALSNLRLGHTYVITLRRAGYFDAVYPLQMTKALIGKTVTMQLQLAPEVAGSDGAPPLVAEPCPTGSPGFVTIDTKPASQIFQGNTLLGETPLSQVQLPSGCHDLTARAGSNEMSLHVIVEPNKTTRYRLAMSLDPKQN